MCSGQRVGSVVINPIYISTRFVADLPIICRRYDKAARSRWPSTINHYILLNDYWNIVRVNDEYD